MRERERWDIDREIEREREGERDVPQKNQWKNESHWTWISQIELE